MSAFGDRLKSKKFPSRDVQLCLDADLTTQREQKLLELEQSARTLAGLRKSPPSDGRMTSNPTRDAQKRYDQVAAELAALEEQIRDALMTIRVTGVPYGDYQLYQTRNRPRPGKDESFNPLTFFLYVARRSGVYIDEHGESHKIEEHEWDALEKQLTDGEHEKLATAIVEVNRSEGLQSIRFLSSSSSATTPSSETSEQPEPKASPRRGSAAGSRAKSTSTPTTKKAD